MIERLLEEANEAATHKGFCDSEMGTNKLTRDQKTQASDKLQADIQEISADIQKVMQDAAETTKQIATIDAEVARATEERHAEKAKNQKTIEDTNLAKAATMNAMTVLKEYYEAAGNQPDLP